MTCGWVDGRGLHQSLIEIGIIKGVIFIQIPYAPCE